LRGVGALAVLLAPIVALSTFRGGGEAAAAPAVAQTYYTPFEAQRLEFMVPVAGTSIDTGHLAGSWTAMLYLNGSEAASSGFELTR
jgi:hypothetical protein